jgi:hypothetical protein
LRLTIITQKNDVLGSKQDEKTKLGKEWNGRELVGMGREWGAYIYWMSMGSHQIGRDISEKKQAE